MKRDVSCAWCGKISQYETGHINRAKKNGNKLYCGKECSGLGRRSGKDLEEKKEAKRLYDIEYRAKNKELLKVKKEIYYQTPAGRDTQKRNRDKMKEYHRKYIQTPEYKSWKREYDRKYLGKKEYGEFWESYILINDLDREVNSRITDYDCRVLNDTLNKRLKRKREYERLNSN